MQFLSSSPFVSGTRKEKQSKLNYDVILVFLDLGRTWLHTSCGHSVWCVAVSSGAAQSGDSWRIHIFKLLVFLLGTGCSVSVMSPWCHPVV